VVGVLVVAVVVLKKEIVEGSAVATVELMVSLRQMSVKGSVEK